MLTTGIVGGFIIGTAMDSRSLWSRFLVKIGFGENAEIRADFLANFADNQRPDARQVPCPPKEGTMVALLVGQSNAGNFAETRTRAGPAVSVLYDGRCYDAADPLLGATGARGSVWPAFADKIVAAGLYRRVLLVPAAVGSTPIETWAPGGVHYPRIQLRLAQVRALGLRPSHVFISQGEYEADAASSAEDYRVDLGRLLEALRPSGAAIFVATTGRCTKAPNEALRAAQASARQAFGAFAGPDMDRVSGRINGCHLSSAAAKAAANAWFEAVRKPVRG